MQRFIALDHFGCLTYAGMQDNNVFGVTECKTKATDEEDTEDEGNEVRNCSYDKKTFASRKCTICQMELYFDMENGMQCIMA